MEWTLLLSIAQVCFRADVTVATHFVVCNLAPLYCAFQMLLDTIAATVSGDGICSGSIQYSSLLPITQIAPFTPTSRYRVHSSDAQTRSLETTGTIRKSSWNIATAPIVFSFSSYLSSFYESVHFPFSSIPTKLGPLCKFSLADNTREGKNASKRNFLVGALRTVRGCNAVRPKGSSF
ncbi:hypothetical protein C8R45DRAFT_962460 [Mycena sanguinolenta]|nr:hypothetical protein C8R45DRAFT_962460 [Mycena sanguinolenta]